MKNDSALLERPATRAMQEETGGFPVLTADVPPKEKDIWDKIAAVAPIISGILIFLMGGLFTYMYNQQQLRLQEIQTIEKFIPHLMGNNQSKRAAILAISSLTNAELAGKFAQIFASQGTVSALQAIAENGSEKDRTAATSALAQAYESLAAHQTRLQQMESALDKALKEKNAVEEKEPDTDEAGRLEKIAATSRERGQTAVADVLMKQAQLLRGKGEEKLPPPPQPVEKNKVETTELEAAQSPVENHGEEIK